MSDTQSNSDQLQILFPTPSLPPSILAPTRSSGIGPQSTAVLQRNLKENHRKYHVFFNNKGFHNHLSHHLLAIWALGASAPIIDAAHQSHVDYQRPAFSSPESITENNFNEHLGDENFYNGYLEYFTAVLLKKGAAATLEEYLFSNKANFDTTKTGKDYKNAEMLNRLMQGLVHPFIHTGYGLEFGLLGHVAEGLAQTAVHSANSSVLLPPAFFRSTDADAGVTRLTSLLPSLVLNYISSPKPPTLTGGTHAFTILARILKDERFEEKASGVPENMYTETVADHGEAILKYASEWQVDGASKEDVEKKIEQLVWMNTIIYGVGGWKEGSPFHASFFAMHLLTSSIFLPSWVAYLTPVSTSRLLRAYFVVCLTWWIATGRRPLDITGFYTSSSAPTAHPTAPGPQPTPSETVFPAPDHTDAITPNPWLPIIQTTLVHANEHLCKAQRALAHWAALYGARVAGQDDFKGTDLAGADKLDGTLFIRLSGLTANSLGWVREGEAKREWGR